MREISGEFVIFQVDKAPAHQACKTISLMEWDTSTLITTDIILNPTVQIWLPKTWGEVRQQVY